MADPRITDEAVRVARVAFSASMGKNHGVDQHVRAALEAALPHLAPQPITSREPEGEALEGIRRWYAAMDSDVDGDLAWPSGLSADNPNLTPAVPQPVVDREALIVTLHKAGAYCGDCNYEDWDLCEDCLKVLGSYADAVLALLNGGAK